MSVFGWIKSALAFALPLVRLLRANPAPSLSELIPTALGNIWHQAELALAYGELATKEKIDAWLEMIDAATGTDPTAIQMIPDMPAATEEEFFDHVKESLRLYLYCRAKVPGYYE